jgi:hypothetical protein
MLDDKEYFAAGLFNIYCMSCNRKYKSNEIRKRWDGLYVCDEDWEPRHPQDFVRGIQEQSNKLPFSYDVDGAPVGNAGVCTLANSVCISGVGVSGCLVSGNQNMWEGGSTLGPYYVDGESGEIVTVAVSGEFTAGWAIAGTGGLSRTPAYV